MKIFWSWQNDSNPKANRHFIREALAQAVERAGNELGLEDAERPELDHDTKNTAGMVEITSTILRKISNSAVFVADLTPIGRTSDGKALPNPNVLIELGWALSELGEGRLIPVLNTADGWKPDDLPFDIRHRGALTVTIRRRPRGWRSGGGGRRVCGRRLPVPGEEVGEFAGRVVGDAAEGVGEPGLRIDAVEPGGGDQRVDRRGPFAATVGTGEQPIFPADGDGAQRPLGGVVAEADAAVVEEAGERGGGSARSRWRWPSATARLVVKQLQSLLMAHHHLRLHGLHRLPRHPIEHQFHRAHIPLHRLPHDLPGNSPHRLGGATSQVGIGFQGIEFGP